MRTNKKIYWILLILSLAGYTWIGFQWGDDPHGDTTTLCMFKNISGLPCPSCGITRSVLLILHGDVAEAMLMNPLGFIAILLLILIPVWIVRDLIASSDSLASTFLLAEQKIKTKKHFYLPLIAVLIVNWGWNIIKDL
ncbi:MAG: DUF2752 domain-containing protein [Bacteroidota bacterium]